MSEFRLQFVHFVFNFILKLKNDLTDKKVIEDHLFHFVGEPTRTVNQYFELVLIVFFEFVPLFNFLLIAEHRVLL